MPQPPMTGCPASQQDTYAQTRLSSSLVISLPYLMQNGKTSFAFSTTLNSFGIPKMWKSTATNKERQQSTNLLAGCIARSPDLMDMNVTAVSQHLL